MRARRAGLPVLFALSLLAASWMGCDGAFRFVDGTGGGGRAGGGGSSAMRDGSLIDGAPDGGEGGPCTVMCEPGSSCSLTAGAGCVAVCQGATCDITLSEHGSAVCQDGARCTIVCGEECSVTCADTSQCTARCPASDAFVAVTRMFPCGT